MHNKSNDFVNHFSTALKENLHEMAGLEAELSEPKMQVGSFISNGLAVIIGITGKRTGRIILDTSMDTAQKISELFNEEKISEQQLVLDSMAEFSNIVSGHTTTLINNLNKGFNLMLTPPSLFFGNKLTIVSPKINAYVLNVKTSVGYLVVSVGFEGGI